MKAFLLLFLACLAGWPVRLHAQNTAAEAALERKANEERFNMLNARVASVLETQEMLLQRLDKLEQRVRSLAGEIDRIKEENAHANGRQITREEVKTVVENKLKEFERKREEDTKQILDKIRELSKLSSPAPARPKPPVDRTEVGETVDYTVQAGDRLGDIIKVYNDEYAKQGSGRITLEQVKKANPEININRIREGQIIRIPLPPKK